MSQLQLGDITKEFGAIQALQFVDISVEAGQAVGLMGGNGAGSGCRHLSLTKNPATARRRLPARSRSTLVGKPNRSRARTVAAGNLDQNVRFGFLPCGDPPFSQAQQTAFIGAGMGCRSEVTKRRPGVADTSTET